MPLEGRFFVAAGLGSWGDLYDLGEGPPSGLLIIHMERNRLVIEIFRGEVLADLQLPTKDGFGEATSLRRAARTNTKASRTQHGKRLTLEALIKDLEDPSKIRTVFPLSAFVLNNLGLFL